MKHGNKMVLTGITMLALTTCVPLGCVGDSFTTSDGPEADPAFENADAPGSAGALLGEAALPLNGCEGPDCVAYDISTQDRCTEESTGPTGDIRWTRGFSLDADRAITGGEIVAFKLQWFSGKWSNWFVVGVNDIDHKFNTGDKTMRRMWSYFYDHHHAYIICRGGAG